MAAAAIDWLATLGARAVSRLLPTAERSALPRIAALEEAALAEEAAAASRVQSAWRAFRGAAPARDAAIAEIMELDVEGATYELSVNQRIANFFNSARGAAGYSALSGEDVEIISARIAQAMNSRTAQAAGAARVAFDVAWITSVGIAAFQRPSTEQEDFLFGKYVDTVAGRMDAFERARAEAPEYEETAPGQRPLLMGSWGGFGAQRHRMTDDDRTLWALNALARDPVRYGLRTGGYLQENGMSHLPRLDDSEAWNRIRDLWAHRNDHPENTADTRHDPYNAQEELDGAYHALFQAISIFNFGWTADQTLMSHSRGNRSLYGDMDRKAQVDQIDQLLHAEIRVLDSEGTSQNRDGTWSVGPGGYGHLSASEYNQFLQASGRTHQWADNWITSEHSDTHYPTMMDNWTRMHDLFWETSSTDAKRQFVENAENAMSRANERVQNATQVPPDVQQAQSMMSEQVSRWRSELPTVPPRGKPPETPTQPLTQPSPTPYVLMGDEPILSTYQHRDRLLSGYVNTSLVQHIRGLLEANGR